MERLIYEYKPWLIMSIALIGVLMVPGSTLMHVSAFILVVCGSWIIRSRRHFRAGLVHHRA